MKYFKGSFIFTIIGIAIAMLWAHMIHPGSEFSALFIVLVLGILEVSLSFDNAVVNAMKLEKLPPKWQHRFLTWGIAIAVFGMRFLFPVLVVSIFSHLGLFDVINMALKNPEKYTYYLQISHPPIITFGASFLIMLFFTYFFNQEKETHWIKFIEEKFIKLGKIFGLNIVFSVAILFSIQYFIPQNYKHDVLMAGIWGILTYLIIEHLSKFLEKNSEKKQSCCNDLTHSCLINFLYLELIDASFSLDGVLGAFALSNDILIITIGLSIGAMFVRSLTIMLVEKKTLKQYIYLENGAHWAIGALAVIMFISSFKEVSEIITGLCGLVFIVSSLISSILKNKSGS